MWLKKQMYESTRCDLTVFDLEWLKPFTEVIRDLPLCVSVEEGQHYAMRS